MEVYCCWRRLKLKLKNITRLRRDIFQFVQKKKPSSKELSLAAKRAVVSRTSKFTATTSASQSSGKSTESKQQVTAALASWLSKGTSHSQKEASASAAAAVDTYPPLSRQF